MADNFYITGGTLPQDANSYVVRRADTDLLDGLRRGEFCYVLNTRQMGKSSLMVRAANQLKAEGCRVAILDLTAIGKNVSVEQWYFGLLNRVAMQVGNPGDLPAFWKSNREMGPMQRFVEGLRRLLLADEKEQTLVLFVDEIDAVRSLPFSADEFFAGIRECYNRRTHEPLFQRLTFCLLGVATPSDLIQDTRTTPFNIGTRIELHDFTPEEAASLAAGLQPQDEPGPPPPLLLRMARCLLRRVLYWTSGHPYMTQRLCREIADQQAQGIVTLADVDQLCNRLFLSHSAQESDDNLAFARNRLLKSEADLPTLLDLYQQVLTGRQVRDDEANPLCGILRLSGVVAVKRGHLRLRNRVYAQVFDRVWTRANLPGEELRRQKRAYRRGLYRAAMVGSVVSLIMAITAGWAIRAEIKARQAKGDLDSLQKRLAATNERLSVSKKRLSVDKKLLEEAEKRRIDKENAASHSAAIADLNARKAEDSANDLHKAQKALSQERAALRQNKMARDNAFRQTRLAREDTKRIREANHRLSGIAQIAKDKADQYLYTAVMRKIEIEWETVNKTVNMKYINERLKMTQARGRSTFEWNYWHRLCHLEQVTFDDYNHGLAAVAFSPDGSRIAIGNADKIEVRDAAAGKVLLRLDEGQHDVTSLAFSRDGKWIVTGGGDHTARVCDAATGKILHTLAGHDDAVTSVAFSPNSTCLVTGGRDGKACVWDVATGKILRSLFHSVNRPITSAAFSPDGRQVVMGDQGGYVHVWEAQTGRTVRAFPGQQSYYILSVAFSPDGKQFVTGGYDGTAKIWDTATGTRLHTLLGHTDQVLAVAYARDGRIATSSRDGTARIWEPRTEKELFVLRGHTGPVSCLAFSPNGKRLLTGSEDKTAKIWDAQTPQDKLIVRGHQLPPDSPVHGVTSAAFSPDGKWIITGSWDHTAHLCDAVTGKVLRTLAGHDDAVTSVAFSRNGKWIATGSRDNTACIWEADTGALLHKLSGHKYVVSSVAFSPDNLCVVTGSDDQTAIVWSVQSGKQLHHMAGRSGIISSVAFSPDGKRIATGNYGHSVQIWNAATGELLHTLEGHSKWVWAVAFSADGKRLVTGSADGTALVWDAQNGKMLFPLMGHTGGVVSVAFSPDGRQIVTSSLDTTARVWDASMGEELLMLRGHTDAVMAAAFSPKDRRIVTASHDNTAIVWFADDTRLSAASSIEVQSALLPSDDGEFDELMNAAQDKQAKKQLQDWLRDRAPYVRQIPARPPAATAAQVDLTRYYNGSLHHSWHTPEDGFRPLMLDLAPGLQTLDGIRFDARGAVQLWGHMMWPGTYPEGVSGIPVKRVCRRLHFLHSAGWISPEGTRVGEYVIHYADGQTARAPLLYGDNIAEWTQGPMTLPNASVAWREMPVAPGQARHHLYHYVWNNPRPASPIASLDFISEKQRSAPFLIAVTAE